MKVIIDKDTFKRTIKRLSYEIIEKNNDLENCVILGIKRKGIYLSKRIKNNIFNIEGVELVEGELDITHYRDDVVNAEPQQLLDVDVEGKTVILVDDVLFTGRTVRAAMDAVMDLGRAKKIQLAVLVDRGHRELPVTANYVGKNIPTSEQENVFVRFSEVDGCDLVELD